MDFTEVILNLMYIVITGCVPIVASFLVTLIKHKVEEATLRIENERVASLINRATDAVLYAVSMVNQTYVDTLKAEGKFDAEAQRKAKMEAIAIAKQLIGEDAKLAIATVSDNIDLWLEAVIETQVRENKQ